MSFEIEEKFNTATTPPALLATGSTSKQAEGNSDETQRKRTTSSFGRMSFGVFEPRATFFGTCMNFMTSTIGVGACSLSSGLASSGYIPGLLLLTIGATASWCACHLTNSSCDLAQQASSSEEIAEIAVGPTAKLITACVSTTDLLATCVILLILLGSSIVEAVPGVHLPQGEKGWMVVSALVVWPISLLKDMSGISKVAVFGVVAIGIFLVMVSISAFGSKENVHYDMANADLASLASASATFAFSFACAILVPTMRKDMTEPSKMSGVINVSHGIVYGIYLVVAGAGYIAAGRDVKDNVIKAIPFESARLIASWSVIVNCIISYPLFLNPVCVQLENLIGAGVDPRTELTKRICLRTALVLLTLMVGLNVPYFGIMVDIVGSLTVTLMCAIFPAVYYYILMQREPGGRVQIKSRAHQLCLLCINGLFVLTIGLYFGVSDLIAELQKGKSE